MMSKFYKVALFTYITVLGILFVFYIPPFQKADESTHFLRTDALYRGQIYCNVDSGDNKGYFFVSKKIWEYINLHDKNRIAFNFNQKYYPKNHFTKNIVLNDDVDRLYDWCGLGFVGYLPNYVGYVIGAVLGSGDLNFIFYMGRLFPLVLYLLCVFFFISRFKSRIMVFVFSFFAMFPMVIHQVTSFSYDALMMVLVLVVLYYFDKLFTSTNKNYDLIFYSVALWFLSASKPGYYPLWMLIFIIPNSFVVRRNKRSVLARFVIFIVGVLLLYFITYSFLPVSRFSTPDSRPIPGWVFPGPNKYLILHDPIFFIKVLVNTISKYGGEYLVGFVGIFGWLDYRLNFFVYCTYFLYFFYLCIMVYKKGLDYKISIWNVFFLFASMMSTLLLVFVSLYVTWTDLAYKYVLGPTGRYFLVVLPLFIILFISLINLFRKLRSLLVVTCLFLLLFSIWKSIYFRYYDYSSWDKIDQNIEFSEIFCGTSENIVFREISEDVVQKCLIGDKNIFGVSFNYKSPEIVSLYRIDILNNNCEKVLYSTYIDISKKSFNGEFRRIFNPIKATEICIRLKPFYIDNNNYLKVGGSTNEYSFKVYVEK